MGLVLSPGIKESMHFGPSPKILEYKHFEIYVLCSDLSGTSIAVLELDLSPEIKEFMYFKFLNDMII